MTDVVEDYLDEVWGALSELGEELTLSSSTEELQLGHAYEALLFMKIAIRAKGEGHDVTFLDADYQPTSEVMFSNGRGHVWTTLRGRRRAVPCGHDACLEYELHHSAWAPGVSNAQHDCDIAVTKREGRVGSTLVATSILGLLEAKCRGAQYPESLDTGRSVAGKGLDFVSAHSILVCRQRIAETAEPYLTHHLHSHAVVAPDASPTHDSLNPVWGWLDACSGRCKL